MSEYTGWGNGHVYRLTRDIYTQQIWNYFFFYTFLLCFYIIDTPHTTSDKDYSSFGRKQKHKQSSNTNYSKYFTIYFQKEKYHELNCYNLNFKLKIKNQKGKKNLTLLKKRDDCISAWMTVDEQIFSTYHGM